jgi:ABC-type thiamine transport system ATPase subunit
MDITRKTTGYLIGELVTHTIKSKYALTEGQRESAKERIFLLEEAIGDALQKSGLSGNNPILRHHMDLLEKACKECWDAQEIVMTSNNIDEVYRAAKTTLITNRQRNIQMRALDALFGEKFFAVLEKSYVLE